MTHPPADPLRRALAHVAAALDDLQWLVGGSTARALSGFATTPNDLDIEVAAADVDRAAGALGFAAVDAVDARARSRRARGRLGGVGIDVTGGLTLIGPGGVLPPDFELMVRFAEPVDVAGLRVVSMPLEEQIVRILVSGDEARRRRFVDETPADWHPRDDYVALRLAAARAAR